MKVSEPDIMASTHGKICGMPGSIQLSVAASSGQQLDKQVTTSYISTLGDQAVDRGSLSVSLLDWIPFCLSHRQECFHCIILATTALRVDPQCDKYTTSGKRNVITNSTTNRRMLQYQYR